MSKLVIFRCPVRRCPCVFLSKRDLDLHLAHFGHKSVLHMREFNHVHNYLKGEVSREHDGADRIIRIIENQILFYRDYKMPRREKVRVLK